MLILLSIRASVVTESSQSEKSASRGTTQGGSQQRTLVQRENCPPQIFGRTCTTDVGLSFCMRRFTSASTTDQGFGASFASRLNKSIKEYPIETVGTIMSLEIGTIFGTYGGLAYLNVDFPAEFAFAFAISRLVRRFRLPVEIAVAKGMKTMAPVLATVRILDLFSKLTPGKEQSSRDQSKMSILEKGSNYVYNTVNQYGLCYFPSSRLVGVVVILEFTSQFCSALTCLP